MSGPPDIRKRAVVIYVFLFWGEKEKEKYYPLKSNKTKENIKHVELLF